MNCVKRCSKPPDASASPADAGCGGSCRQLSVIHADGLHGPCPTRENRRMWNDRCLPCQFHVVAGAARGGESAGRAEAAKATRLGAGRQIPQTAPNPYFHPPGKLLKPRNLIRRWNNATRTAATPRTPSRAGNECKPVFGLEGRAFFKFSSINDGTRPGARSAEYAQRRRRKSGMIAASI